MRCYHGCPDKELKLVLDDQENARKELAKIGAHATYFPMEQKWMVFKNYESISSFHDTIRQAANSVLSGDRNEVC